MTDREALYAAILDRPADTHARLVYADYLDEHGDRHDRAHAELIRLQCSPDPDPARVRKLARRAWVRRLFDRPATFGRVESGGREFTTVVTLDDPPRGLVPAVVYVRFRHGFPAAAWSGYPASFLRFVEPLVTGHPVTRLAWVASLVRIGPVPWGGWRATAEYRSGLPTLPLLVADYPTRAAMVADLTRVCREAYETATRPARPA